MHSIAFIIKSTQENVNSSLLMALLATVDFQNQKLKIALI